jgi:hypothetical protein
MGARVGVSTDVEMRCDLAAGHTLKVEGIATLGGPP